MKDEFKEVRKEDSIIRIINWLIVIISLLLIGLLGIGIYQIIYCQP